MKSVIVSARHLGVRFNPIVLDDVNETHSVTQITKGEGTDSMSEPVPSWRPILNVKEDHGISAESSMKVEEDMNSQSEINPLADEQDYPADYSAIDQGHDENNFAYKSATPTDALLEHWSSSSKETEHFIGVQQADEIMYTIGYNSFWYGLQVQDNSNAYRDVSLSSNIETLVTATKGSQGTEQDCFADDDFPSDDEVSVLVNEYVKDIRNESTNSKFASGEKEVKLDITPKRSSSPYDKNVHDVRNESINFSLAFGKNEVTPKITPKRSSSPYDSHDFPFGNKEEKVAEYRVSRRANGYPRVCRRYCRVSTRKSTLSTRKSRVSKRSRLNPFDHTAYQYKEENTLYYDDVTEFSDLAYLWHSLYFETITGPWPSYPLGCLLGSTKSRNGASNRGSDNRVIDSPFIRHVSESEATESIHESKSAEARLKDDSLIDDSSTKGIDFRGYKGKQSTKLQTIPRENEDDRNEMMLSKDLTNGKNDWRFKSLSKGKLKNRYSKNDARDHRHNVTQFGREERSSNSCRKYNKVSSSSSSRIPSSKTLSSCVSIDTSTSSSAREKKKILRKSYESFVPSLEKRTSSNIHSSSNRSDVSVDDKVSVVEKSSNDNDNSLKVKSTSRSTSKKEKVTTVDVNKWREMMMGTHQDGQDSTSDHHNRSQSTVKSIESCSDTEYRKMKKLSRRIAKEDRKTRRHIVKDNDISLTQRMLTEPSETGKDELSKHERRNIDFSLDELIQRKEGEKKRDLKKYEQKRIDISLDELIQRKEPEDENKRDLKKYEQKRIDISLDKLINGFINWKNKPKSYNTIQYAKNRRAYRPRDMKSRADDKNKETRNSSRIEIERQVEKDRRKSVKMAIRDYRRRKSDDENESKESK